MLEWIRNRAPFGQFPTVIILACAIGFAGGSVSLVFAWLIQAIQTCTLVPFLNMTGPWRVGICFVPVAGLICVAWVTHRMPEVAGFGIPEVIAAVARKDGVIRFRIILAELFSSALCIGTGGSVGREGPIVQIGSALGSSAGQLFGLSAPKLKTLVACGAAAGISATFNAPLSGVVFAGQIILGNFAVRSLTPVVISSVIANLIEDLFGQHGRNPVFQQLDYEYYGNLTELPLYFVLGAACGLLSIGFSRLIYSTEDIVHRWLPAWWVRAVVAGTILGLVGGFFPSWPPSKSDSPAAQNGQARMSPVFGVGYEVVDHALHLCNQELGDAEVDEPSDTADDGMNRQVWLDKSELLQEIIWLLPVTSHSWD